VRGRQYHVNETRKYPHGKRMIDMNVIRSYMMLSTPSQVDVAKSLQMDVEALNSVVMRMSDLLCKLF
jgi:singapore isolate B (sub-type 7) whole genome shotgun sequence assembly, scaffold_23